MPTRIQVLEKILPELNQLSDDDIAWIAAMLIEMISARFAGLIEKGEASGVKR